MAKRTETEEATERKEKHIILSQSWDFSLALLNIPHYSGQAYNSEHSLQSKTETPGGNILMVLVHKALVHILWSWLHMPNLCFLKTILFIHRAFFRTVFSYQKALKYSVSSTVCKIFAIYHPESMWSKDQHVHTTVWKGKLKTKRQRDQHV